jgi:hypothetical protein
MNLTIYHGTVTPFVAVGKNQCNMLEFAFKYPSWHSYTNDKQTLNALNGLLKRGCIIVNEYNQFKINMGV